MPADTLRHLVWCRAPKSNLSLRVARHLNTMDPPYQQFHKPVLFRQSPFPSLKAVTPSTRTSRLGSVPLPRSRVSQSSIVSMEVSSTTREQSGHGRHTQRKGGFINAKIKDAKISPLPGTICRSQRLSSVSLGLITFESRGEASR